MFSKNNGKENLNCIYLEKNIYLGYVWDSLILLVEIIQWDSWIILKNTVRLMNSRKNKLNGKIS